MGDELTKQQDVDPAVRQTRRERPVNALAFAGILLVAFYFRFAGLNWDANQHLHPDERFLTMVTGAISIPNSLGEYFDSRSSPLNPYNKGFGLFVYGDFPVTFTRLVAEGLTLACTPAPDAPIDATTGRPSRTSFNTLLRSLGFDQVCEYDNETLRPLTGYDEVALVGRVLSALFDLATLVWLFLIARQIYGTRAGLVAMTLGALAAMHLQQAHFYTADTFATFFVAAAMYFALRADRHGFWLDFVLAGVSGGLATASRINVVPVLGLALLAAFSRAARSRDGLGNTARVEAAILRCVVVLASGLITFRIFMPYAFDGLLSFDERWSGNMQYIQTVISGEDPGGPPGVQWTDRAPIVFPWVNMVFWGMGLPFGLAAWIGWAFATWKLFGKPTVSSANRKIGHWLRAVLASKHLLVWVWLTAYFVWQGSQWVKSMRYLLPVYPFLAIIAGWLLVSIWRWARTRSASGPALFKKIIGYTLPVVVLVGTFLWAVAFTEIYRRPVTRIAATEWIYENVPTSATLQVVDASGPRQVNLQFPNVAEFLAPDAPLVARFSLPESGQITGITFRELEAAADDPAAGEVASALRLRIQVASDPAALEVFAEGDLSLPPGWQPGAYSLPVHAAQLEARRDYYVVARALEGEVVARSSTLANEHWDDGIPLRTGGRDGFSIYTGVEMQNYNDDTPEKVGQLAGWLDQTDYISLTSNRLYGSIPRQPLRYPLTTEYYRLLFTGQLGFDLVAEFTSYPTLGPFEFPDQETTQALGLWPDPTRLARPGVIPVYFPPAEEVFSVYDHPRVLIFKKRADFGLQNVLTKLGRLDLEAAYHGFNPRSETAAPSGLLLDGPTWEKQQVSGTWAQLFDRNGLLNANPGLGALIWYLVVVLLGWAVFPLVYVAAPGLADRGYGLARTLGVLLLSFLVWFPASLKVLPFTRETIALAVVAMLAVGALVAWPRRSELRSFLRGNLRLIVTEEIVFAAAFALFLFMRYGNPDLWHPWKGGEKPMDFAYFNAVIKSQYFPPYDAWFSGGYITYYYYGFVVVATLTKLSGIVPAIAYNLSVPTVFALAAMGTFSVAHGLSSRFRSGGFQKSVPGAGHATSAPIVVGVVASVFVMLIGNLGEVKLLTDQLAEVGKTGLNTTMPFLKTLVDAGSGLMQVASGQKALQFPNDWWYWNPTRIIPAPEGEAGPITEFPFFTFTYADLHAHMMALPITLLALGLAVSWLARAPFGRGRGQTGPPATWLRENWADLLGLLLGGLAVGALRATNTWDFPTYLGIGIMALAFGTWATESLSDTSTWLRLAARAGLFVAFAVVLFMPFTRTYATEYARIEGWQGSRTEFWPYLYIHGIFLLPIVTFLFLEARRWGWRWSGAAWTRLGEWRGLAAVPLALAALLLLVFALSGVVILLVAAPIMVVSLSLLLRPRLPAATRFWMLIVLVALALSFLVEVVVLRGDISRMNTVFKFYYQMWVLLGIAGAVALGWLWPRVSLSRPRLNGVWQTATVLLVAGGLLYPPFAAKAKLNERFTAGAPPTLDGMAYMADAVYNENDRELRLRWDYEALIWMQDNVAGTPVVAEGHSRHEYLWGGRVSIYTGLPTIIGWHWHQRQQRTVMPGSVLDLRIRDADQLYSDASLVTTRKIIERYNVRYIYVGELEQAYYPAESLAKFDTLVADGALRVAYQNPGVTIYEVATDKNG